MPEGKEPVSSPNNEWAKKEQKALKNKHIDDLLEKLTWKKYLIKKLEQRRDGKLIEEPEDKEHVHDLRVINSLADSDVERFLREKQNELDEINKELARLTSPE